MFVLLMFERNAHGSKISCVNESASYDWLVKLMNLCNNIQNLLC